MREIFHCNKKSSSSDLLASFTPNFWWLPSRCLEQQQKKTTVDINTNKQLVRYCCWLLSVTRVISQYLRSLLFLFKFRTTLPSLKGEMMIISQKIDCCRHALCALSKLCLIVLNKMENNSSVESWFYCLSSNICQFIYFSVASSCRPFLAFLTAGLLFRPLISHPIFFP